MKYISRFKATFYHIPCIYDYEDNSLTCESAVLSILLEVMIYVHVTISFLLELFTGEGLEFPIKIYDRKS